jgi:hypothetical protein
MKKLIALCIAVASLASYTAFSIDYTRDPDPEYDRLDGTGKSGKTVNVIEWEGNLEVHVYPKGSLKGLALKIDRANKDKPVMVIGYRFDNSPKEQLIRRAILGIDLKDGFKTFRDPSADEYDKIVISNNGLSNQMVAYQTDPAPTQLYPDGHPALEKTQTAQGPKEKGEGPKRLPASAPSSQKSEDTTGHTDEAGAIKPFDFK